MALQKLNIIIITVIIIKLLIQLLNNSTAG